MWNIIYIKGTYLIQVTFRATHINEIEIAHVIILTSGKELPEYAQENLNGEDFIRILNKLKEI